MIRAITFDLWNTIFTNRFYSDLRLKYLTQFLESKGIFSSLDKIKTAFISAFSLNLVISIPSSTTEIFDNGAPSFIGLFFMLLDWTNIFSAILYIPPWNPIDTRLSQFGDPSFDVNPNGAIFFNVGTIITGFLLFPYIIGLFKWSDGLNGKVFKYLLIFTQFIGCVSGFTLLMLGIFPIDTDMIHEFWAGGFFSSNLLFMILIGIILIKHKNFSIKIAFYGWIVAIINLSFIVMQLSILEWFTVLTALGHAGLIAYNTYKLSHK